MKTAIGGAAVRRVTGKCAGLQRRALAHPGSVILRMLVYGAGILTAALCLFLVGTVLVRGIPALKPSLFAFTSNSETLSMLPSIFNTLEMIFLTLLIALPVGLGTAVYLTEYASRASRLVSLLRMAVETLQGLPSVLFGLFGYLLFVTAFGWGYSMMAGVLTLVLIILPVLIRTAEEAILSVPDSYREGSYALGAGRLRTVFRVILPAALPGILGGVVLSVGRIVGETAALIFTAGTAVSYFTGDVMGAGRTLAVHLYALWNEGLSTSEAYATAVILLVFAVVINALSEYLTGKLRKRYAE